MSERSLAGRRVLVTGGTTGIGRGVAVTLAEAGAKLFVCGWDDYLDDALADLRRHDEDAGGLRCDVADESAVAGLTLAARDHMGGIDAVIANAGVPGGGIMDMAEADWRRSIAINYTGALATCYHAVRVMRAQGTGGDVVITGSMSTHRPGGGSSVYASANAGLNVFAECFRREVAEDGVKVAIIEPGKTGSDLFGDTYTDAEMARYIAEDRMLAAEDVGRTVAFVLRQPSRSVVSGVRIEPRLHV